MAQLKEAGHPTATLADFVANTTFNDLPAKVVYEVKRIILDDLGCMLGGYATEIGWLAAEYVRGLGGLPEATDIGSGNKTSCLNAAYANGRMGDALDANDTLLPVHLGNPTVAAALPVCERLGASGRDLITSVAIGLEVGTRLAISTGPPDTRGGGSSVAGQMRGRLPSGDLAAAGAAAKGLGLDAKRVAHAFGIAGANANMPPWAKYYECEVIPLHKYADHGRIAETGVSAALLAETGYTSFDSILDGDSGLWSMRGAAQCDFELMLRKLGDKWFLLDNSHKPWPCCRLNQYPLTILTRIISENNLQAEQIKRILIRTNRLGSHLKFKNQDPVGMASCEFSYPHSCAMVAFGIKRGADWYSPDVMSDQRVREFRRKVDVELQENSLKASQSYKDGQVRRLPTSVEVTVKGQVLKGYTEYAKGDPWTSETYFTDEDLKEKFRDFTSSLCIGSSGWRGRMEAVMETAYDLENVPRVADLTRLLQR